MTKSIIEEGKTSTEAIEKGLKKLNVSKDMVNIKILEEDKKRSFYSILSPRVVKVELTVKENVEEEIEPKRYKQKQVNENMEEIEAAKAKIEKFLKDLLKDEYKYDIKIENFNIIVKIDGENVGCLIGYRGETINAIQTLITAVANKDNYLKINVFVDVSNYKEQRIKKLEELAEKVSKTVIKTGKTITLEPMSAYERKVIHTALQGNEKIKTFSKGEEPHRKVVISLNK